MHDTAPTRVSNALAIPRSSILDAGSWAWPK
jgi:hypothetical protein